jgi:hypothetical protein
MPFAVNAALTSTDMNNTLRGLFRDNTDHAVTGTLTETDMSTTTITGGTIGATGGLRVLIAGTGAGAGGSKTLKMYLGASSILSFTVSSGSREWVLEAWIFNTAQNAQRITVQFSDVASGGAGATPFTRYFTTGVDTSVNVTLKTTATLVNTGDTLTSSMFDVFVVQIT